MRAVYFYIAASDFQPTKPIHTQKVARYCLAAASSCCLRPSVQPAASAMSSATLGSAWLVAAVSRNARRVRRAMKSTTVSQYSCCMASAQQETRYQTTCKPDNGR